MRSNHGTVSTLAALAAAVIFTMGAFDAQAYPTWEGSGLGACSTCHGNVQASPYMPPSGDPMWTADLMSAHNAVLNDCQACHVAFGDPNFGNVSLSSSASATFPNSCLGCHGRAEDGETEPGAGLRRHHTQLGVANCGGCHADVVPVGENVLPFNYGILGIDPCNPGPVFSENFAANPNGIPFGGLNNDGDVDGFGDPIYDQDDLDCGPVPSPTPTATPTATATAEPTATPTATATAEPTATPTATATATATPTGVPTATPTAEPTATATPTPTGLPTATPTGVPTATPTAEATPTPTPTGVPTATPTGVPTATPTAEPTATPTAEATPTPTPTGVATPTATARPAT
jgi:hypothetical protein